MKNVNVVETGFTAYINLIFVLYTVTKNALQSGNQFHFQSNILKVNCV
jgi:hypothetical protein